MKILNLTLNHNIYLKHLQYIWLQVSFIVYYRNNLRSSQDKGETCQEVEI